MSSSNALRIAVRSMSPVFCKAAGNRAIISLRKAEYELLFKQGVVFRKLSSVKAKD